MFCWGGHMKGGVLFRKGRNKTPQMVCQGSRVFSSLRFLLVFVDNILALVHKVLLILDCCDFSIESNSPENFHDILATPRCFLRSRWFGDPHSRFLLDPATATDSVFLVFANRRDCHYWFIFDVSDWAADILTTKIGISPQRTASSLGEVLLFFSHRLVFPERTTSKEVHF